MWKLAASLAFCAALMATVGCETESGVLDPTPLGTGVTTSVNILPPFVTTRTVNDSFCPTIPPFIGSLDLIVQAGNQALSVTEVQMTFTDTAGLSAPSVTLPAPVLTRQYGSTLIAARSQLAFPLTFPFGCGTRRTGSVVVVVVTDDENGKKNSARAIAAVQ